MSKSVFMAMYRAELLLRYAWAANEDKLARMLSSVHATLTGTEATWNHDGEAVVAAWRAMGGKGKPTLKALRALPE